jgi:lipopolysaccharide transport system ATP-binding protein
MDGLSILSLYGKGMIEVLTPPLKLVAELYAIHVMVWDTKFQQLYSAQMGMTFHVRHHLLSPHFGVFHEAAEWHWEPDKGESPPMHQVCTTAAQSQPS